MTDSSGGLSGSLGLTAHDVWVADQALLAQLNSNPEFDGFEAALGVNNGPVNPDGYIQAGGVTVTMLGSSFLVQNTGTADAPAGLTVGDGGLHIVNLGSDPATVILFGQQNSGGTITGGDEFFASVDFTGAGGFTDNSTVNGCDVGGSCGADLPPGTIGGAESILGPVGLMNGPSDLISNNDDDEIFGPGGEQLAGEGDDEGEDEEGEDGESGSDASIGIINTGPVSIDQPVDEPVTSGNDGPGGSN
jgi:hypothetical protein